MNHGGSHQHKFGGSPLVSLQMKQNSRCIMVETSDGRKFFTLESNYQDLLEFAKACNSKLVLVEVADDSVLLQLEDLARKISDGVKVETPSYELVETKVGKTKKKTHRHTADIRKCIKSKFEAGDIVDLHDLMNMFEYTGVGMSCICNHVTTVKKEICSKGRVVNKIGAGRYQLTA